tara:strand:- start:756 stop:1274 length:519 start_codon:yes stop_codon:yes gene_type:complete
MPASIDYPDGILPLPLVANASHKETKRLLRTTFDSGYVEVRKRFTRIPVDFKVQIILDQSSLSFFQAWYANTLDYGVNWFNMDLPVGDSIQSAHECRITDNPDYKLEGRLYRVNLKIEAIELNLGIDYDEVMEGVIETLGGVRGFDKASEYLDKFDTFVNTTFPSSGYGPGA